MARGMRGLRHFFRWVPDRRTARRHGVRNDGRRVGLQRFLTLAPPAGRGCGARGSRLRGTSARTHLSPGTSSPCCATAAAEPALPGAPSHERLLLTLHPLPMSLRSWGEGKRARRSLSCVPGSRTPQGGRLSGVLPSRLACHARPRAGMMRITPCGCGETPARLATLGVRGRRRLGHRRPGTLTRRGLGVRKRRRNRGMQLDGGSAVGDAGGWGIGPSSRLVEVAAAHAPSPRTRGEGEQHRLSGRDEKQTERLSLLRAMIALRRIGERRLQRRARGGRNLGDLFFRLFRFAPGSLLAFCHVTFLPENP